MGLYGIVWSKRISFGYHLIILSKLFRPTLAPASHSIGHRVLTTRSSFHITHSAICKTSQRQDIENTLRKRAIFHHLALPSLFFPGYVFWIKYVLKIFLFLYLSCRCYVVKLMLPLPNERPVMSILTKYPITQCFRVKCFSSWCIYLVDKYWAWAVFNDIEIYYPQVVVYLWVNDRD